MGLKSLLCPVSLCVAYLWLNCKVFVFVPFALHSYSVHGPRHEESVMNLIQKEVEKCDSLSGFFIIMSMAGGTGSGLGAFIARNLQDQYFNSLKMNHIIWPYGTGEVRTHSLKFLYFYIAILLQVQYV